MRALVHLLGPVAVAIFLLVVPIGQIVQVMVILVGLNIVLVSMITRDFTTRRREAARIEQDQRQLYLLRRTVPHLRARRPTSVVEAQVRWRQASEAHRRRNVPVARALNDQNPRIGPWRR